MRVLRSRGLVGRQRRGGDEPGQRGCDLAARDRAPHEALRRGVGAQPVGAVERDAGGLARGPDPGDAREAVDVGLDATHGVVSDRPDGDRRRDGVQPEELDRHLANERQTARDAVCAKVGEVELEVVLSIGRPEAAPREDLLGFGPRNHIPRRELHELGRVVSHEALAPVVPQVAALATTRLGHEDAARDESGRVELEELHVLQGQAGAPRHGHAVAGHRLRVRREPIERAPAARGNKQRLATERDRLTRGHVQADESGERPVLDEDVGDEELVVPREASVPLELVVQRLHLEEAGLVGGQGRARVAVSPERSLRDVAVLVAGPRGAPVVELVDFLGDRVHKGADDVLVSEEVGALDRIPRVQLSRVTQIGAEDRRRAALCADGVGTHQLDLRNDADVHMPVKAPRELDGSTKAGEAGPQNEHVVLELAVHDEPRHLRAFGSVGRPPGWAARRHSSGVCRR